MTHIQKSKISTPKVIASLMAKKPKDDYKLCSGYDQSQQIACLEFMERECTDEETSGSDHRGKQIHHQPQKLYLYIRRP